MTIDTRVMKVYREGTPGPAGPLAAGSFYLSALGSGATADGTTNDSAAVQAVLDTAGTLAATTTLGVVYVGFPYGAAGIYRVNGLLVPERVVLVGQGSMLKANAAGPMVTLNGNRAGIVNLGLNGNGLAQAASGVEILSGVYFALVDECRFEQMAGRGIWAKPGSIAAKIRACGGSSLLQNTGSLSTYTGALEVDGSDHYVNGCEFTTSRSSVSSASLFSCGIAVRGANHFVAQCIGEISDIGFYVNAAKVQMVACRADLNRGHGWLVDFGSGAIVAPKSLDNGMDAADTYYGWLANEGNFSVSSLIVEQIPGTGPRLLGGIKDTGISGANVNRYDSGCRVLGGASALRQIESASFAGASFDFAPAAYATPVASGATTIDVDGGLNNFQLGSVAPVNMTNFNRPVIGQRIVVRGDGQTTFVHGTYIFIRSGANLLAAVNTLYEFVCVQTAPFAAWFQI